MRACKMSAERSTDRQDTDDLCVKLLTLFIGIRIRRRLHAKNRLNAAQSVFDLDEHIDGFVSRMPSVSDFRQTNGQGTCLFSCIGRLDSHNVVN